jgi:biopolymer transport protein ExbB/TolQ
MLEFLAVSLVVAIVIIAALAMVLKEFAENADSLSSLVFKKNVELDRAIDRLKAVNRSLETRTQLFSRKIGELAEKLRDSHVIERDLRKQRDEALARIPKRGRPSKS